MLSIRSDAIGLTLSRLSACHTSLKYFLLQLIPVWWRWFYWANPVSWTIYGVIASQFADSDRVVTVPGQATTMVVKDFLEKNMGFKHDFLGYVVLAHFGYVIIFFFLFGYGIKCLNFQKR